MKGEKELLNRKILALRDIIMDTTSTNSRKIVNLVKSGRVAPERPENWHLGIGNSSLFRKQNQKSKKSQNRK
jgi:hypothetical protein